MSASENPVQAPPRVRRSGIHGKGLFAATDMPADTLILPLEGRTTKRDGAYVLWIDGPAGPQGIELTNDARFVNHARQPNAAFFDDGLWSLHPIGKGDEITHDYGDDWGDS